jgi:hypothetical protein
VEGGVMVLVQPVHVVAAWVTGALTAEAGSRTLAARMTAAARLRMARR